MKAVRWPDGRVNKADTWEELENLIMSIQWEEYESREQFRENIAERALVWSGIEIDTFGTSEAFLWEMERAQMLLVFESPNPPDRTAPYTPKFGQEYEKIEIEYEMPKPNRPYNPWLDA